MTARRRRAVAVGALWAVASVVLAGPAQPQPAGPAGPATAPLVRLPFPQDEGSLTPYTFELGYPLMTLVYDTLLWRDADGVPQPWLARSVDTSPDGRTVTVRLAAGALWHDGTPVTSADVAFTFDYVKSRPHPRFTGEVAAVERVDTPDAATAVIRLRQTAPGFQDQPLADLPILPMHLWKGLPRNKLAPDGNPVGSGPYRLVDHVVDQRYRFEANRSYFRGRPAVDVIEVPIIASASDTVRALERREVDMIPASLPADLATSVDSVTVKVEEGEAYLGTTLLLNLRTPPFDRVEVRRAVAQAIDLAQVARAIGKAVPADHGQLHPASPYASPDVLHKADRTAAGTVLRSLGQPITVSAPDNDPVKAEAGRQVVQALRGAGATAELALVSRDALSTAVGEDGTAPTFQAAVWVTPPLASYDPTFLGRMFGSDPASAPLNYTGYRSPAFDDLARRVATTADKAGRRAATTEALALLASDVPSVPLVFADGAFAYRPAVFDGWIYVKGSGILDKRSFLDPKPAATPTETTVPVEEDAGGGGGGLSAGVVALAALGAAGVLALVAVVGGRRRRP
ncbi:MAG: ABC transporter substrate-binding protein [Acidimicrobiales bacterium]